MRFEIPKMMNPDNLYYVSLPDQLEADRPVLGNPLTAGEIRDNIAKVVFAQNCYCCAMLGESNPFKRSAIFGLFSGNSGVTLNIALQWLKLREHHDLKRSNIARVMMQIEQISRFHPIDFFASYFEMEKGNPEMPDDFKREFKFKLYQRISGE